MSRPPRRRAGHDSGLKGAGPHRGRLPRPPGELPRELAELKAELGQAIWREHRRGARRRKTARIGLVGLACALGLSGSALAAGAAIGVIHLGGGVTAKRIAKVPSSKGFGEVALGYAGCYHDDCAAKPSYVYQVSGGHTRRSFGGITCGRRAEPFRPRRVFITSHVPLSHAQLRYAVAGLYGAGAGRRVRVPRGTMTIVKLCNETPFRSRDRRGAPRGLPPEPDHGVMREVGLSPLPAAAGPLIERAGTRAESHTARRAATAAGRARPGRARHRAKPPSR